MQLKAELYCEKPLRNAYIESRGKKSDLILTSSSLIGFSTHPNDLICI